MQSERQQKKKQVNRQKEIEIAEKESDSGYILGVYRKNCGRWRIVNEIFKFVTLYHISIYPLY